MSATPLASIVIPARNVENYLGDCLESIAAQVPAESCEVIVVDDGSTDSTRRVAEEQCRSSVCPITIVDGPGGLGPGPARHTGLARACGEWVLFVDADDAFVDGGLARLLSLLRYSRSDIVAFDWADHPASATERASTRNFGRRDKDALSSSDKRRLAADYLRFLVDPSVIYMAFRRSFLLGSGQRFAPGLHEDFDFTLSCLLSAERLEYADVKVMLKRARPGSIVHTVDRRHLEGFARSWRAAESMVVERFGVNDPAIRAAIEAGRVALVATRAREVIRHAADDSDATDLLGAAFEIFAPEICALREAPPTGTTVYELIVGLILESASPPGEELVHQIASLDGKSWSCADLQGSVFLRPDEIRTCCKRFFVGGEMRGDVALALPEGLQPDPAAILEAKRHLHRAINAGDETSCSGCPFLSLDRWPSMDSLDVKYLSMEQHSVCNLRCTYCSEEYFGGAKPSYDVAGLVEELAERGALAHCHTVVWGGGEPTVARDFTKMTEQVMVSAPHATQRFLTNSTRFSPAIGDALRAGVGQVVTSVDAGSEAVFAAVRGRNRLDEVMVTLAAYADINPGRVTVKYIFTDGNCDRGELQAFVRCVSEAGLLSCFFQISADFKHEQVTFEEVASAVHLFSALRGAGADFVYLDELFRQRVIEVSRGDLLAEADASGWQPAIADPGAYDEVAVWGAGQATELLLQTAFIRRVPIATIVDTRPDMQGRSVAGVCVERPEVLTTTSAPVILSAVQGLPLMAEQFAALGLPKDRLVRDLII